MARRAWLRHLQTLAKLYGVDSVRVERRRSLAACMAAQRRERNGDMAAFRSDESDIGLSLLPHARPSSNLTLTSRSMQGRELGMHSHDGVHGGGVLSSRRCGSCFDIDDAVVAQ